MSNLSNEQLEYLLTLADAATLGNWHLITDYNADDEHDGGEVVLGVGTILNGWPDLIVGRNADYETALTTAADYQFIAAAHPSTVRLLIQELLQHRAAAHATGEAGEADSLADLTPTELQEYEQCAAGWPQMRRVLNAYKGVQASRQYGRDIINDMELEAGLLLHQVSQAVEKAQLIRGTTGSYPSAYTHLIEDLAALAPAPAQTPPPVAPRCGGGGAWVSVADRVPEFLPDKITYGSAPDEDDYDEEDALQCRKSAEVLVYASPYSNTDERIITTAAWLGDYWETGEDGRILANVTHWQPLPQPPTTCATCPAAARDAAEAGEAEEGGVKA